MFRLLGRASCSTFTRLIAPWRDRQTIFHTEYSVNFVIDYVWAFPCTFWCRQESIIPQVASEVESHWTVQTDSEQQHPFFLKRYIFNTVIYSLQSIRSQKILGSQTPLLPVFRTCFFIETKRRRHVIRSLAVASLSARFCCRLITKTWSVESLRPFIRSPHLASSPLHSSSFFWFAYCLLFSILLLICCETL